MVKSQDTEVVQLAGQSAEGAVGSSFFLMPNTELDIMGAGDDATTHTGSGLNYVGGVSNKRERGLGTYSGPTCFDEDVRIYQSLLEKVTPSGAGTAKTWEWEPEISGADTFQPYTAERGQTGAIEKFLDVVFNSITLRVTDAEATRSGDLLGKEAVPGTAMTASPTTMDSTPTGDVEWELFHAADMTAIAAESNKILTGFESEWNYGPKFVPWTPINRSNRSHAGLVQRKPATGLRMALGFDVSGSDYAGPLTLAKKRAGTPTVFRIKGTGPEIVPGTPYLYVVDLETRILNVPGRTRIQEALLGQMWSMVVSKVRVKLVNKTAA